MATRQAACHRGQLRLDVEGEPFAVSICNCLACQRRTGSAFGMQAGFKREQVKVEGRFSDYTRISDEADRKAHVFHFCPDCGSQVFYTEPTDPDLVVVSVGSFADPSFPWPTESGYDSRRHPWVRLPDSVSRYAPELWDPVRPLFASGRYAEAAEIGLELISATRTRRASITTWRVARASRAAQPMPWSTSAGRSRCGRDSARWPSRTPTSIRSAANPVFRF